MLYRNIAEIMRHGLERCCRICICVNMRNKVTELSDWLHHRCALIRRAGPQWNTGAVEEGTQKNVWNINTCHRAGSCFPLPPCTEPASQRYPTHTYTHTRSHSEKHAHFWQLLSDVLSISQIGDGVPRETRLLIAFLYRTCWRAVSYQSFTLSTNRPPKKTQSLQPLFAHDNGAFFLVCVTEQSSPSSSGFPMKSNPMAHNATGLCLFTKIKPTS